MRAADGGQVFVELTKGPSFDGGELFEFEGLVQSPNTIREESRTSYGERFGKLALNRRRAFLCPKPYQVVHLAAAFCKLFPAAQLRAKPDILHGPAYPLMPAIVVCRLLNVQRALQACIWPISRRLPMSWPWVLWRVL